MTKPISKLGKRLNDLIDLCDRIDALVHSVGLEDRAKPVLTVLTKQADWMAERRYAKIARIPLATVQKHVADGKVDADLVTRIIKKAAHGDQPAHLIIPGPQVGPQPHDYQSNKPILDDDDIQVEPLPYAKYNSSGHIAQLFEQIRRIMIYAKLAGREERRKHETITDSETRTRGRPKQLPDPQGHFNNLTALQQKCMALDLKYAELGRSNKEPLIKFKKSAAWIADKLKVSKRAVEIARKKPAYVQTLRGELISAEAAKISIVADRQWKGRKPTSLSPESISYRTEKPRPYLANYVKQNWTGPVTSPIDGQLYTTQAAYVDHLIAHEVIPPINAKASN